MNQLEKELKEAHEKELQDTLDKDKEDMCTRLEELRQRMVETGQTTLKRALEKKERELLETLRTREQELRDQFVKEKQEIEMLKAGLYKVPYSRGGGYQVC